MARGRPPIPDAMKKLKGTYRPDRARNEPKADGSPTCPTWLHREAKREWKRIVPLLQRMGLVGAIDRSALAAYCETYAVWWEATEGLKKYGLTQMTESGIAHARPEVGIRNKALEQMRKFLIEFGMTPSARSRIKADYVPPETEEHTNPFMLLG